MQADGDGAGGDEDDAVAMLAQLDDGGDEGAEDFEDRVVGCFVDDGAGALRERGGGLVWVVMLYGHWAAKRRTQLDYDGEVF